MNGDEQIAGQISLFDLLPQSEVDELTEDDLVEQVSQRLNIKFDRIEINNAFQSWHQYKCKLKNVELTIDGFSTYDTMDKKDGQRMILVGFSSKKNHGGGGAPCDNVDEVVEYFKRIIDRENMTKQEKLKEGLTEFEQYIGECKYCMWYGYGLYEPYGHKRRKGTEGQNCQWEVSRQGIPPSCKNHSFWKPSIYAIPKLCGNCRHSNCFHYQKKPRYKENDSRAFSDPVEEPNIYCTREDGSVKRQQPFLAFYSNHFGACLWDRQHEWDTCDAWQTDGQTLKGENE